MSGGRVPEPVGGAGASLWPLLGLRPGLGEEQNSQQVSLQSLQSIESLESLLSLETLQSIERLESIESLESLVSPSLRINICIIRDGKSRYGSDSIISGSSSIDRRSLGKSIDRKSSDSDYSGSGSRKSSSDRKLSASRHSLLSRGSDL